MIISKHIVVVYICKVCIPLGIPHRQIWLYFKSKPYTCSSMQYFRSTLTQHILDVVPKVDLLRLTTKPAKSMCFIQCYQLKSHMVHFHPLAQNIFSTHLPFQYQGQNSIIVTSRQCELAMCPQHRLNFNKIFKLSVGDQKEKETQMETLAEKIILSTQRRPWNFYSSR